MVEQWVLTGMVFGLSAMLGYTGWVLMSSARLMRRQTEQLNEMFAIAKHQQSYLKFQSGIIAALQAGMIGPHHLKDIDFTNLPVELRLSIMAKLIEIAVAVRTPREERHDRSEPTG